MSTASVTIGVTDTLLPGNIGVWEISAAGAKRLADEAEADLAVDIGELSAAYLGGTRVELARRRRPRRRAQPGRRRRRRRPVRRPRGAVLLQRVLAFDLTRSVAAGLAASSVRQQRSPAAKARP